jgi:glycosyltransferase involved in cell wall biosynthesis
MHILMFSITPLFPSHDLGGAQKHLRSIARHLGALGHTVVILSTARADTPREFMWHERVTVRPILGFRQPFPGPYDVPAYQLAEIVQDVAEHLDEADVFYIHDGEFLFPPVYAVRPTVVSLRDNVYPETVQGGFGFRGHRLILISQYARDFFIATAGRFYPALADRTVIIRNGIDWSRFRPTPPGRILDLLGFDPAPYRLVLHPHRPEETKGLWQTIEVADRLINREGMTDIRVCVPEWLGTEADAGVTAFYARARALIEARGLTPYFRFHPWVPAELLQEYFSLGAVTLALGNFVESFGNAVYESLGCGTPVVVARISSHRELLPEGYVDKVDFNDHDDAAERAAAIVREGRRTPAHTLEYLHAHYSVETQLARYVEVITGAQMAEPMQYTPHRLTDSTRYRLAPWCYRARAGIYHDYRYDYLDDTRLTGLIDAFPAGFSTRDAATHAIDAAQMEAWRRSGYLVPVVGALARITESEQ